MCFCWLRGSSPTIVLSQAAVKQDLCQTVVSAIIESDFDSSGSFSDQEIKILELRMKSVPGLLVNHKLLVQTVHASDRKLSTVLKLMDHLDRDDLTDEQRIFKFSEKHLAQHKPSIKK